MNTLETNLIDFTRVNNGRFVCHFLNFVTDKDEIELKDTFRASLAINPFKLTDFKYELAIERAKKIGGKKFHNKQYGGGIAFHSSDIFTLQACINALMSHY